MTNWEEFFSWFTLSKHKSFNLGKFTTKITAHPKTGRILRYIHLSTFNFEFTYKNSSFMEEAASITLSDLQNKGETIKLLPYYLYDGYFIYKTAKALHLKKITNHLKYK